MALSEDDINEIEAYMYDYINYKKPPKEFENYLSHDFKIENNSVYLLSIRNENKGRNVSEIAKMTYSPKHYNWKLYWKRYNGNWELLKDESIPRNIDDCLNIIERDKYGVFWG